MARDWDDFYRYAAEVRVDLGNGRVRTGSGYVIGPYCILTALHVLLGQEAILARDAPPEQDAVARRGKVFLTGDIEVRANGDFVVVADINPDRGLDRVRTAGGGDYCWRPAELLWPPVGADIPRFDVAVLRVAEQNALKHIRSAPPIACVRPPDKELNCQATGFAKWAEVPTRQGIDLPNPCTVYGFMTPSAERYRTYRPFTVLNGAPPTAEEWQGLSGALVFDNTTRAAVGLASEARRTSSNNVSSNNVLGVTRLVDLVDVPELQGFWTAAALSPPQPAELFAGVDVAGPAIQPICCSHMPRHDPSAFLHQYDRSDQVDEVFSALPPVALDDPETSLLPPIFFISGRIRDLPHEMVTRLRNELGPDVLGNNDRVSKTQSLQWRFREHAANGVIGLQRDIVRHLTNSRQILDFSKLADKARGQDWTLEIDVCQTDARDIDALARFLTLFAGFGGSRSPPALYVILFAGETGTLAKEDARIRCFLDDLDKKSEGFADRLLLFTNLFLDDCAYTHIKPWVEDWEQVCGETALSYGDLLEHAFGNTRPYPLRRVKEALSMVPAR
jgi:hypothetical protein